MGTVNDYNSDRLIFALESQAEPYVETYDKFFHANYGVYLNMECVAIGKNVRFLPGSVIGFKGFSWGFREDKTPEEIRHEGGVIIGDNAEIGANCTIMRSTLRGTNTIIGNYVKMDSHGHIAHNCVIGDRCMITSGVGFCGSVTAKENSWFGTNSSIMNGVTVGKNNLIGIGTVIREDTEDNAVMCGNNRFLRYRE